MKRLFTWALFTFFYLTTYAQAFTPVIKAGTVVNIIVTDHGKTVPVSVTIKNPGDTLNISWKPTGKIVKGMLPEDITRYFTQPHQEGVASERFQNDETFISASRNLYKRFVNSDKKTLLYQGIYYMSNMSYHDSFILDGRPVINAIYLETKDRQYKIWVLNNAAFPLILQNTNPLLGISFKVVSIK